MLPIHLVTLVALAAGDSQLGTNVDLVTVSWRSGVFVIANATTARSIDPHVGALTKTELAQPADVRLRPSRASPDGKAKVQISAEEGKEAQGTWTGGEYKPPLSVSRGLRFEVVRGNDTRLSTHPISGIDFEPYWSPDGRYVLWLFRSSFVRARVGSGGGLRTQILAAPEVLAKARGATTRIAEENGLAVLVTASAMKAREKTVVYAARGFEADAQRVATALGRGASVGVLDWKADAEIVVALGTAALEAK